MLSFRLMFQGSMAQGASEAFFGIELNSKSKQFVWNGSDEADDDVESKLQILQACLGVNAKDGERNVVEATTSNFDGKDVTHPILSLKLGQTEMARMDLGFVEKVTFKLAKGNGPVHLCGSLLHAYAGISDDDDEYESEDDEQVPALVKPKGKADAEEKPSKSEGKEKGLLDDEASEDDEDEDDDVSDEGDELDSDEEDDDIEMSDEDDDEDSEEEEKLEPPKSKKAKIVTNGHTNDKGKSPGNKKEAQKAATPKKQPEAKDKTPKSGDNKTPKGEKKDGKNVKTPKSTPTVDEVKAKLLKSPNLPKSVDKFKNLMKSAHKMTDEKEVQGIWDWLQKNKK